VKLRETFFQFIHDMSFESFIQFLNFFLRIFQHHINFTWISRKKNKVTMEHHAAQFNYHHMIPPVVPTSGHPDPTSSPPQSVPGRRTPLGAVGIGGFYAQGAHMGSSSMHMHSDENKPESSLAR
jgi:hypothetical protein